MPEELDPGSTPQGTLDTQDLTPANDAGADTLQPDTAQPGAGETLLAGKYRSVEEAEAAIAEAQRKMHEATTARAEAERKLRELETRSPQPETAPEGPDPTKDEDFREDYFERLATLQGAHANAVAIAELKGEEPPTVTEEQMQQAAWNYAKPRFDRRTAKAEREKQEQDQRLQQTIEQHVAPLRFANQFQQVKEKVGVSDVTQADLEEAAAALAREAGQDPEQAKAAVQFQNPAGIYGLTLVARGLKSMKAPAEPPKPTPAPPKPSPTPPAVPAPAAGPRDEGGSHPVPDAKMEEARALIRRNYKHVKPEQIDDYAKAMLGIEE